ncbi:unnamed protein product [Psylliodes chrysocephalus]|uniref:BAG domain-containing protein n=1 Tax=Psylliodes chrysocephalus TaxID=3402493 RepID=A0A9P0GEQ1_9CUCU|nr:unnamed protein product [Psylliodes chrysocephala]
MSAIKLNEIQDSKLNIKAKEQTKPKNSTEKDVIKPQKIEISTTTNIKDLTNNVQEKVADKDVTGQDNSNNPDTGENLSKSNTIDNKGDNSCEENSIILKILEIKSQIEKIEMDIRSKTKDKLLVESKIIEETLLQYIIKLDNIDTNSLDKVRDLRKKTILYTQDCLKLFDSKVR